MNIKYIRDWLNGSTSNSGNHWVEIMAFNSSGTNVALNKTVTGDPNYSFYSFSQSSGDLQMLTNGVTSYDPYIETCIKGTTTCVSGLAYVQVDLGGIYNIKYVKTFHYWSDSRMYNNKLEVSEDGVTWTTLYDSDVYGKRVETGNGLVTYINDPIKRGIRYNDATIPQNSELGFIDYSGSQCNKVYYNGQLVWEKLNALPFEFVGNTLVRYTGTSSAVEIPTSYSAVKDADDSIIFIAGNDTPVDIIADDAFANNTAITTVTIPSGITTIGARAFQKCYNLSMVNISSVPLSIGYCAFALTNISLPSFPNLYNCTKLGQGCFATRKAWRFILNSLSNATMERIRATTMDANLTADGYTGYGGIYVSYGYLFYQQTGGSATASGTPYATINFNAGNQSWSYAISGHGSNTGYYLFNSSTNPPNISASSVSFSGSNVSSYATGLSLGYYDSGGVHYYRLDVRIDVVATCLCEGTRILLADGTYKNIEDIAYDDLLLTWNMDTGNYDYQYPLCIAESRGTTKYILHLDDDTSLEISGSHYIYDPVKHLFIEYGDGAVIDTAEPRHVMKYGNGTYSVHRVVSIEIKTEPDGFRRFGIYTTGTLTVFGNDVLIGTCHYNYVGIDDEHKGAERLTEDKDNAYSYERFKNEISTIGNKYLVLGSLTNYAPLYFEKDDPNMKTIYYCYVSFLNMTPTEMIEDKHVCNIGFLDDSELSENKHIEDTKMILPNIISDNEVWYCVGDMRVYRPGSEYVVQYPTLFRAVKIEETREYKHEQSHKVTND